MRVLFAPDAFAPNEVYVLPGECDLDSTELGVAAWLVEGIGTQDARRAGVEQAMDDMERELPSHEQWLLVCHSAEQPDTRVMRHRRLWASLEARGLSLPAGERSEERVQSSDGGIRWFGALRVGSSDAVLVERILDAERASTVAAVPTARREVVGEVVRTGWAAAAHGPPPELIRRVCESGGIILHPVGIFDDPEAGAVALGERALVGRLASHASC